MRHAVFLASSLVLALGLAVAAGSSSTAQAMVEGTHLVAPQDAAPITPIEYLCSPGFRPGRSGTCVAVSSRAEIEQYIDQPIFDRPTYQYRHRRRHRGLRERY